ncbi:MAG TPA: hypothetical protein VIF62_16615 [Labilithrix sp.]
MPKMQVYLDADLYKRVKRVKELNVSAVLQRALEEEIARLERLQAGREAIADYEAEFGKIPLDEAQRQWELDGKRAIRPMARRAARAKARARKKKAA